MTAKNTHRRAVRPVTPAVRAGRAAAGAAMATGLLLGGAAAATAEPQSDSSDVQAEGAASAVLPPVTAPAADLSVSDDGEDEEATPALASAPDASTISVKLPEPEPEPEPEPVVEDEEDGSDEEQQSTREDDDSSRSQERSSREDDGDDQQSQSQESEDSQQDQSGQSSEEESSSPAPSAAKGGSILATARSGVGTPYVFGGTSPSGWDCSGFVQWVYGQHGIDLPRGAAGQAAAGTVIPRSEAQPGDLVYKPGHIGIYAGGNSFVDAGNSRVDTSERNIYSGSWTFIRVG